MLRRFLAILTLVSCVGAMRADSTDTYKKYIPEVHATLRARYELDTETGDARFQVRNARVNLNGYVTDFLSYFLRADFCDRGKVNVLDAFATFRPSSRLQVMMGQMRVPLSVDASRAVNQYWFVNRAFPGKDMWSSRKVGLKARYHFNIRQSPAYVEGGLFSSASTITQDTWSKNYT
ncbi:MAG: porin, partial [Muribaculaceae bacterium]|nr:porin [Muribaculaceae bacterium]